MNENPRVLLANYLTTSEVCKMLGVTLMTLYKWRKEQDLPYYVLDGERRPPIRYRLGEIKRWAKENGRLVYWVPERFSKKKIVVREKLIA